MGNLALNKSATASSCVIPFAASKAVDGSIAPVSRWVSSQVPAWLSVNLGGSYWINRWVVRHMGAVGWAAPSYNLCNFKLQISNDNVNWVDVDVVNGNTVSVTDRTFNAIKAQFVRAYVSSGININPKLASIVELEVYEAPPTSPYLLGLTLSSGTLQPAFSKNTYIYNSTVEYSTSSITITPTAEDSGATIKINGVVVPSETASTPINLNVGNNSIAVQVTSKIGGLVTNYTVNVNRLKSINLSNLTTSAGTLTPAFESNTTSYTVDAAYDTTSITVTPTAQDSTVSLTVNGTAVTSGSPSQAINLNIGSNTIAVVVNDMAGNTKTYTVVVTRSSNTQLSNLRCSITFTPIFSSTQYNYTATTSTVTSAMVVPTISDKSATMTVNGVAAQDSKSVVVPLNSGANVITIEITPTIGSIKGKYILTITKN